MSRHAIRAATAVAVLAAATLAGVVAAFAAAFLGHEILVRIYGEDLAPIDDTLPMAVAVGMTYLVGVVSGLVVLGLGWRRWVRR
jgi:hypothetical protein